MQFLTSAHSGPGKATMVYLIRSIVMFAVGGALIAFIATNTRTFDRLVEKDFLEYWAAGRLNLHGENPYDPALLLAEQRKADLKRDQAVMMWNPPPSLPLYMPIGALPAMWAALLWAGLQLYAVIYASKLLWQVYAPGQTLWPSPILAVCSAGTWWVIAFGQNTGFILLGLAGFLHFTRKDKPFAAGACAALTALKPHLLAVFGVLLVVDALTRRGAKTLAAGIMAITMALGIACITNPHVIEQFVDAVRHPAEGAVPLSAWWLPVPAFWLRKWLAPQHFSVQFIPCAIACGGFLVFRLWKWWVQVRVRGANVPLQGREWDWSRMLPLVVAVSCITTPYGGWLFDLPVLLVPIVWAAAQIFKDGRRALFRVFVMGQAAVTAASLVSPRGLHEYWWVAPAMLVLCLMGLKREESRMNVDNADQKP